MRLGRRRDWLFSFFDIDLNGLRVYTVFFRSCLLVSTIVILLDNLFDAFVGLLYKYPVYLSFDVFWLDQWATMLVFSLVTGRLSRFGCSDRAAWCLPTTIGRPGGRLEWSFCFLLPWCFQIGEVDNISRRQYLVDQEVRIPTDSI